MTKCKILLVDDDLKGLELLKARLLSEGYEVVGAKSGRETLQEVLQSPID